MQIPDLFAEYKRYKRALAYERLHKALQTVHDKQGRLLNFYVGIPAFTLATTIYVADGGWIWGQLSLIFLTFFARYCAQLPYSSTEGTDFEVKSELDRAVQNGIKNSVFGLKKVVTKSYFAYSGMVILGVAVIFSRI